MSKRESFPIPSRWLYCPRKSDKIISERFLAFKTPLSKTYNPQMPEECIFTPEMVFDYCKMMKYKLGLWIDLTYTKRFYDPSIVENRGARYIKLQCRGHGETPSVSQTQSFIEIVDNFISERPFDTIGVHCTHGFNRTGFLLVSYLVERLDCSVAAALSIFASARAPGIYKQDYINELFSRYEPEEQVLHAPELPSWCQEYDDSVNDNVDLIDGSNYKRKLCSNESSTSKQASESIINGNNQEYDKTNGINNIETEVNDKDITRKKRRREMIVKDAAFMPGVSGVVHVTNQPRLGNLQQKVQDLCGWKKNGFPGAQPVSMNHENINRLHEIPYRVSWKADGTRYMMFIDKRDKIYFFDRNLSCFQINNLSFLKAGNLHEHLECTLLDGEMVIDNDQGQLTPRYLIYDIIKLFDQDVGKEPFFPYRQHYIKNEIIEPRYSGMKKGLIERQNEPFSIRMKEFWDIRQSASLLGDKFAKSLLHKPDGLIFQPSELPYTPGVCSDVFKWKPLNMNSVDFRLIIDVERGEGLLPQKIGYLYVGGYDGPFGKLHRLTKEARLLNNKIVECTLNHMGGWEFMRERTDKKMPNSYNTAISVLKSITNPVTAEYLIKFIAKYGYHKSHHDMAKPSNPQQILESQH